MGTTRHEETLELKPIASSKKLVTRSELIAFSLVILGAFLSVGSVLAFVQNNYLRSQDSCGTADALQPICAQIAGYYAQISALAIIGVGVTIAGFYLGARFDQMRQV
jgi:type IV secretory pathway VirB2 component (pilin)